MPPDSRRNGLTDTNTNLGPAPAQRAGPVCPQWKTKTLSFNNFTFGQFGAGDSYGHNGFYKHGLRGIHVYRQNGALKAYIVNNPQQGGSLLLSMTTADRR